MNRALASGLLALLMVASNTGMAATETIFYDAGLCDFHDRVCANIRITFSVNEKIMEIHGRLHKPAGAGRLVFYLRGVTLINEVIEHPVTIEVDGQYNEILRAKFRPPLSNQTEWTLKEMVFYPAAEQ